VFDQEHQYFTYTSHCQSNLDHEGPYTQDDHLRFCNHFLAQLNFLHFHYLRREDAGIVHGSSLPYLSQSKYPKSFQIFPEESIQVLDQSHFLNALKADF
jgi:hypothetical protein